MRTNISRALWNERFPLLGVKDDVILNKRGELTVGWELSLPPVYSLREQDYAALNEALLSAVRVLPAWCVVHRQDIYLYDSYKAAPSNSFLGESYQRHFAGRRYLVHKARIFLTFSSRSVVEGPSRSSGLISGFRGGFKGVTRQQVEDCLNRAQEFIGTVCASGFVSSRRLTYADYVGSSEIFGVIEEAYLLGMESNSVSDLQMTGETVSHGDSVIFSFHVGEARRMPVEISDTQKIESLSSGGQDIYLSFGAKCGILMGVEHIVNHVLVTVPQVSVERQLESERKRKMSGSSSAENEVGAEESREFIRSMHAESNIIVYSCLNVVAWCHKDDYFQKRSAVSSALQSMGFMVSSNLIDTPVLWYAGIPGAAPELGKECLMRIPADASLSMYAWETYTGDEEGGNFYISDRVRHTPFKITMFRAAMAAGRVTDYNAMVVGPTGSGKSFVTNELLRNVYDDDGDVTVIDVGDSYEGQTQVVNEQSGGKDGFYYCWDDEHRLSFNPFVDIASWVNPAGILDSGHLDVVYFTCLLQTIWSPTGGWTSQSDSILSEIIRQFVLHVRTKNIVIFDDFVKYVRTDVARRIKFTGSDPDETKGFYIEGAAVSLSAFDVDSFLFALAPYGAQGSYGFFLNEKDPRDLFSNRWVVFEVAKVADDKSYAGRLFFSLLVLSIMNAFQRKMREDRNRFKVLVIEEAWMALANKTMAPFLRENWKVGRKYSVSNIVVTQQVSDLVGTEVEGLNIIKDTIVSNTGTVILLDQKKALSSFGELSRLLNLTESQQAMVLSVGKALDPRFKYREVFISRGGYSSVYATEVSVEEALAFESEKKKKLPLLQKAVQLHSIRKAIEFFAQMMREEKRRSRASK